MSSYRERKLARVQRFEQHKGVSWVKCVACNGSGYHDNTGSPPCGSCDGTGKCLDKLNDVRVVDFGNGYRVEAAPKAPAWTWRDSLKLKERLRKAKKDRK